MFTMDKVQVPVPKPWVLTESRSRPGHHYFYNTVTRRSSWEHPSKLQNHPTKNEVMQPIKERDSKKDQAQALSKRKLDDNEEPGATKKQKSCSQPERLRHQNSVYSEIRDEVVPKNAQDQIICNQQKGKKEKPTNRQNESSRSCSSHKITPVKVAQSQTGTTLSAVKKDLQPEITKNAQKGRKKKSRKIRDFSKSQSPSVLHTEQMCMNSSKARREVRAPCGPPDCSHLAGRFNEYNVGGSLHPSSSSNKPTLEQRTIGGAKNIAQARLQRLMSQELKGTKLPSIPDPEKDSSIPKSSQLVPAASGQESSKSNVQERPQRLTSPEPHNIQSLEHNPEKVLSIHVPVSCGSPFSPALAHDSKVEETKIEGLHNSIRSNTFGKSSPVSIVENGSSKNTAQLRLQKLATSLCKQVHVEESAVKQSHIQQNPQVKNAHHRVDVYAVEPDHKQEEVLKIEENGVIGPASKRMKLLQNKLRMQQTETVFKDRTQNQIHSKPLLDLSASDLCNEEAMEVEYTECDVLLHIEELRSTRGVNQAQTTIYPPSFLPEDMEVDASPVNGSGAVHLVLDTNILLSQLNFVENLRDKFIAGRGSIILFLPWQVLQELDTLKERGKESLKLLARKAINFLHANFRSKHPYVKGQRFGDISMEHSSCPDDSILYACLQLQKRGADVILVSNDINLCNKALVSDVTAFTKEQFDKELKNSIETHPTNITTVQDSPFSTVTPSQTENISHEEDNVAAVVMNDLKVMVKDIFSRVVSCGMEKEYGHLWPKRTILPPPWKPDGVVQCLIQHWLPICGAMPPARIRDQGNKLVQLLSSKSKGRPVLQSDVETAVNLTMDIFKAVSSVYEEFTRQAEQLLENLLIRLKNKDVPVASHPSTNQDMNQAGYILVQSYFQSALTTIIEFCNLKSHGHLGPAQKQQAVELLAGVQALLHHMHSLLSKPLNSLSPTDVDIRGLLQLFGGNEKPLSAGHLLAFCQNDDTRNMLEIGVNQFASYAETLKMMITSGGT